MLRSTGACCWLIGEVEVIVLCSWSLLLLRVTIARYVKLFLINFTAQQHARTRTTHQNELVLTEQATQRGVAGIVCQSYLLRMRIYSQANACAQSSC